MVNGLRKRGRQPAGRSRLRTGQHPRPQLYRLPHRLEELVPELPRPPIESSVARHLARGLRGVRAELGAEGAVLRRAGVQLRVVAAAVVAVAADVMRDV